MRPSKSSWGSAEEGEADLGILTGDWDQSSKPCSQALLPKGGPPGFLLHLFPSGLSAQEWRSWWRLLWSFIRFASSIHSSSSGSSSLIFLCRNTLCFIGYILCGHQEVPRHPVWGGHGTQAGPFLQFESWSEGPKTENKSSTLKKKTCSLVPAI